MHYVVGLVPELVGSLGSYLVVTQPEPWAVVGPTLAHPPRTVIQAGDLSPAHLELLVEQSVDVSGVIALGGGSAMAADIAKVN